MRPIVLALAAALSASPAVAGENCASDVAAAFTKQRHSAAYRVDVTSPADPEKPEQVFDYQPPQAMYRKIVVPGEDLALETIGIGDRAWSREGGGWTELKHEVALVVERHLSDLFSADPVIKTPYTCLGKVSYAGKTFLGYQTEPETLADGAVIARTVYVEPETGLPAFNVLGTAAGDKPPVVQEAYTYPTDIVIKEPEGAHATR